MHLPIIKLLMIKLNRIEHLFINCIELYSGEVPSKDGKVILDNGNFGLSTNNQSLKPFPFKFPSVFSRYFQIY